jgi:precorrin-6B methylase 2
MKLIIISAVKECKKDIVSILSLHGVQNFSLAESKGYKIEPKVANVESWFATGSGTVEEVLIHAKMPSEQASECVVAFNAYNNKEENEFKINAYVMHIEQKTV